MALTTTDMNLSNSEGWQAIVLTGTEIYISEVLGNEIMCRFDINSTSAGFTMAPGDTLSSNEIIYVKARYNHKKSSLIVVRD